MKRYPIEPVAKPRMTQRDQWKKRPVVLKYRAFKDECRIHQLHLTTLTPILIFEIGLPKSLSKKQTAKMLGQAHQKRPDIDNLVKAVLDAVLVEDSAVHGLMSFKVWTHHGHGGIWVGDLGRESHRREALDIIF